MTVEFGVALLPGPAKGQTSKWINDLDAILPELTGHFKSLWATDHFSWDDKPTYEAWTIMSYLAARWPRFDIGSMVLSQSYRNPAMLAKMAATLQSLSGGRLIMGMGAGWKEDEYRAYDFPYPKASTRIEQLEDTVEILKRMWTTPGKVTYHGKHYNVIDAYCEPKPEPVPIIAVGGGGRKTTLVAARHADWWNISDTNFQDYSERMNILHQHCADIGRDPASIRLTWFGRLVVGATEAEAMARGGGQWTRENALAGTPTQVVEQMLEFVDVGVDYFMLEIPEVTNPDVRSSVLDDVLPSLR